LKILTIANQKGGVGKTTTVASLAGLLSEKGEPTVMLDMDPHGSLTSYFGHDPDEIEKSIYSIFKYEGTDYKNMVNDIVIETRFDDLYLLPASTAMATLDRQLGTQSGKGLVIKNILAAISGRFSNVLIDCPPNLGILMINALAACDHLVIPVQTEFLSLKGLERMVRTIEMMSKSRQSEIPYTVLPTMFDTRTRASRSALKNLREKYASHLSEAIIPIDTKLREASRMGVPPSIVNRNDRGVKAYKKFMTQYIAAERNLQNSINSKNSNVVVL